MSGAVAAAAGRDVPRETLARIELYTELLEAENQHQNLVSAATLDTLWDRHIADCAQLVRFEPAAGASWLDIGSGAGLPGLIIALLVEGPVTLVEPRRLRADFLQRAAAALGLSPRVAIIQAKAERAAGRFDVITARAVAPLPRLLEISAHLSTGKTLWVLPKGRSALGEVADARRAWHGAFHVERSATDAESYIVVARKVRRR